MIKTLAVLTLFAVTTLPTQSFADGTSLRQFFKNTEGNWQGRGQIQAIDSDANPRTESYSLAEDVTGLGGDTWNDEMRLTPDATGKMSVIDTQYMIRGDGLFTRSDLMTTTPLKVLESTETKLTYSLDLINVSNAQPYTMRVVLDLDGSKLTAHVLKIMNGVQIADDTAEMTR